MKKIIALCCLAAISLIKLYAQEIYRFSLKDNLGKDVSLSEFKGKTLLIVNTATRCGFTPQYNDLEAIYEKYRDQGFEIIDIPCNQFGAQAPGTINEIHSFCTTNFNIQFPQFDKIDVNGDNEHPLYTYLKAQQPFRGFDLDDNLGKSLDEMIRNQDAEYAKSSSIKWNFTKFLISKDGRVLKRYEPTDKMAEIETDLQIELNPALTNMMARRSIRKYLDQPVEHEKLMTVVKCGINAPSGMNRQPWIIRVVEDQKLIADVNEVFKKANPDQVNRDPGFKNMFRNAPNIICVATPADGSGQLDAGLLGENMMLAAQALGLGTCCLGGPVRFLTSSPDAKFFIDALDIPDGYSLCYILAIGYPDECPEQKPRDASKVKFIK